MALILDADPSLTTKSARKYLESTCDKVGNYNYFANKENGTWSNELGYGRVNAGNALQSVSRDRDLRELGANLEVFPNPVAGELNLAVELRQGQDLEISLLDLSGKEVWTAGQLALPAGRSQLSWELPRQQLAGGLYVLRFANEEVQIGKKLILSDR